tara:strand:+ start:442 stop:756 length:315 start_codon:yes stop_codon:yes gene_type:complete
MAETPEIDELAKRYLDLWQEHLSGMAADSEWSVSMTRLFAAFLSPVKEGEPADAVGGRSENTGSETGTTPSVGPSADGGADLRELQRRIAALEERLAKLEGGAG